jgi:hypothetical protein
VSTPSSSKLYDVDDSQIGDDAHALIFEPKEAAPVVFKYAYEKKEKINAEKNLFVVENDF